jgi:hypothetical protein
MTDRSNYCLRARMDMDVLDDHRDPKPPLYFFAIRRMKRV